MAMAAPAALTLLLLVVVVLAAAPEALAGPAGDAHPGYAGAEADTTCGLPGEGAAGWRRLEEYGGGRIVDITHAYRPDLPAFEPGATVGQVVRLKLSMEEGSEYNLSELRMECHAGTHVDAPGHMNKAHFAAGLDVDKLDLDVLNGPALLVDVPRNTNITAEAMESLHIPKGVRQVLFRTLNTDRGMMWNAGGDFSFVGFTEDGAQWLVDNTDIKLVGLDYLSVAAFDYYLCSCGLLQKCGRMLPFHEPPKNRKSNPPANIIALHHIASTDIILVEALKLDDIQTGLYMLHCLPLRLVGSEGSPIRCILIK